MLYIDDKNIEISEKKIFVGTYTKNGNKEYNDIPFEDDIFFEVFNTEKFLDTEIESNIVLN